MAEKLMIIGGGGHAKVCLDIAKRNGCWQVIELLDDRLQGELINGHAVVGTLGMISNFKDTHDFVVAIGDNRIRSEIFNFIKNSNYRIVKLIDPSAIISENSDIGYGSVVMPNVVINSNTVVGQNCIINTASIIEHDCVVGDHVHLSPNTIICGGVNVGKLTWIGASSTIIQGISICVEVMVAAGAVVVENILISDTYIGIPARRKGMEDLKE